jgi:hypothetical protein
MRNSGGNVERAMCRFHMHRGIGEKVNCRRICPSCGGCVLVLAVAQSRFGPQSLTHSLTHLYMCIYPPQLHKLLTLLSTLLISWCCIRSVWRVT